jgi:hypothetical protein
MLSKGFHNVRAQSESKAREKVTTMKLFTIERPSMLLAACAPSMTLPAVAAPAMSAAEWAPVSRAHQVQIQAELVRTLVDVDGSYGTTGFVGSNSTSKKRLTDGASGVPPRGRPV